MKKYFYVTKSNAAPFFSDEEMGSVRADTPRNALNKIRENYSHPAGLYAAGVWKNFERYIKGDRHLVRWLSKRARILVNGVKCPECGGKTEIVCQNVRGGRKDIHACKRCNKQLLIDMSEINTGKILKVAKNISH